MNSNLSFLGTNLFSVDITHHKSGLYFHVEKFITV